MNQFKRELITFAVLLVVGVAIFLGLASEDMANENGFWQIDNASCVGCGGCATECVLPQSAVKAVMNESICEKRNDCPAFFSSRTGPFLEGPEYEVCPSGALLRQDNGDGSFTYSVDTDNCIGCGRCVEKCERNCSGALSLVIDKDLCVDCNQCHIAQTCPKDAVYQDGIPRVTEEEEE